MRLSRRGVEDTEKSEQRQSRKQVRARLQIRFCLPSVLLAALLLCVTAALVHGQSKAPEKRLNLNTATVKELDKLPEVGPKLAKAIVEFREKSGPFRRVEDLLAVPGISKRRLEKTRPHVYAEAKPEGLPRVSERSTMRNASVTSSANS